MLHLIGRAGYYDARGVTIFNDQLYGSDSSIGEQLTVPCGVLHRCSRSRAPLQATRPLLICADAGWAGVFTIGTGLPTGVTGAGGCNALPAHSESAL